MYINLDKYGGCPNMGATRVARLLCAGLTEARISMPTKGSLRTLWTFKIGKV